MRALSKTRAFLSSAPLLALAALAPSLSALPQEEEGAEGGEAAEAAPEDDRNEWLAVTGGDIHTGTGEVLRGATLLAKNGKIVDIGYDLPIPGRDYWADVPEEERWFTVEHIDATGMRVYPGLVAISSSGLVGTTGNFEDQVDPFNMNLVLGLASGITSTGQGRSAVKLKRYISHDPPKPYDFDGVVVRETTYVSLPWGSSSSRRSLREKLVAAADYLREYRQWEEDVKKDKELKEPSKKGVDSSVLSVLKGEVSAQFRANDRSDLLALARLAQEFDFRPIIDGCREGWTVADELGRAGAMAIVTPRERRDKDETLVREGGSSIENAAILHKAGVPVAVSPSGTGVNLGGIMGRDILHLPIEVGFAIRGGLPEDAGLAAVTIVPARMMGISHRVGSLEVGKDADLIVTDGDLMHYQTFVQYAVVDGELAYDKQEELFFAHIRPRPEAALAPETRVDPGENPPAEAGEGEGDQPDAGEEPDAGEGDGGGDGGAR